MDPTTPPISNTSSAAYVAAVVGGLVGLLIAAGVLFMWRRSKGERVHRL